MLRLRTLISRLYQAITRSHRGTLLSVAAHPDDDIWGWGGTLAKAAASRWHVISAVATRGEAGHGNAQIRTNEQIEACNVLGVQEVRFLGYTEASFDELTDEEGVQAILRLILEVNPKEVLTYGKRGLTFHPGHLKIHNLTTRAFHLAALPGCVLKYYDATQEWDATTGLLLQRIGAIDASVRLRTKRPLLRFLDRRIPRRFRELKHTAVNAHRSQVGPLDRSLHPHGGFEALRPWFDRERITVAHRHPRSLVREG